MKSTAELILTGRTSEMLALWLIHDYVGFFFYLPAREGFGAEDVLDYTALLGCQLLQAVLILLICAHTHTHNFGRISGRSEDFASQQDV